MNWDCFLFELNHNLSCFRLQIPKGQVLSASLLVEFLKASQGASPPVWSPLFHAVATQLLTPEAAKGARQESCSWVITTSHQLCVLGQNT